MPRRERRPTFAAMATIPTTSTRPASLGGDLERVRLEHRARRLMHVVGALRARRESYRAGGTVPLALGTTIRDLDRELGAVRRRLSELSRAKGPR